MIAIGKYNSLHVKSKATIGMYLTDGRDSVLLPARYVPDSLEAGDGIEVFIYLDNENRPVATTLKPFAEVEDFAFLVVKDVNEFGAFLDWGIAKDVFVSYAEQRTKMHAGESHLVYLFMDEKSGRIAATTKWSKYVDKDTSELLAGEEVELLIAGKTDLGYRAIVDNRFEGLIYENEVFGDIEPGDKMRGYVKLIRDDGKIDLRLRPEGYAHIEEARHVVLKYLEQNSGRLNLGDKSDPKDIYERLQLSKKAFKKTIGALYKERLITISDFEITLLENKK
jgi:predicted RNA-binding protein (virulence factor B family)